MKMILKDVRLSFPSLWVTESFQGADTGKYAATFLVPKESDLGKAIAKAVQDVAKEQFGSPIPKSVKYPLKDGDTVDYDGYEGMYALKANTKKRPVVIDRDKTPVTEDDNVIYAGCYVNASVEIYANKNEAYGKRVGCQLNGIQFVKDGDAFGGSGANAMEDFEELEAEPKSNGADASDNPFA